MRLRRAVGLEGSVRRASRRGRYRFERPVDAWRRHARALGLVLLVAAFAARAVLPWIIQYSAKRTLSQGGWSVSIERTRLALWRASWRFEGVRLLAPDGAASFEASSVELSLSAPSFRLARARARLVLDGPKLTLARATALAEVAARLRALSSDPVVEWRVDDGAVSWPRASNGPLELSRLHAGGLVADGARGARSTAFASALGSDGARVGLSASASGGSLLLRAAGEKLPGRFTLAMESGEGAHLLAGPQRALYEPRPLSVPAGPSGVEQTAAALNQALEAASRPKQRTSAQDPATPG